MRAYARGLFGTAAAFNIAVGAALVFGRGAVGPALGLGPLSGADLVVSNLAGLLVALLGAAYALIAREPERLRPLIALAAAGKVLAFACVAIPWLQGQVPASLPALAAGDLVYAALFAHYLWSTRGRI